MTTEVRVPPLPESVTDATILSWLKQAGDSIKRDDILLELETDKVVLEVPAIEDGILGKHNFNVGDTVSTDDILTFIEAADNNQASSKTHVAAKPANTDNVLSPSVRKLIQELEIDPDKIQGTGKNGRILKSDVMQHLDQTSSSNDNADLTAMQSDVPPTSGRSEQRVPMSRLRQRVAERLLSAQHESALLTTFNEVNLQAVIDLRKQYQDRFVKHNDIKLGFMSFFIKASLEALKRFPVVNASIDNSDVLYHNYFDIGIAVGSERGLVVPVIRDADTKSFADLEKDIKNFAQKARDNALTISDLEGGTFTITNGGIYGSMLSTPIINPPQSAILGMHNITERAVVENGNIVARPMMYLALSYDHRLIDGKEAVQFLLTIKECLEDPARMLLEI